MLYLIYGQDTYRARGKLAEIVGALEKKAVIYRIDAERANEEISIQLLSDQDLFGQKFVVVFEKMCEGPWQKFLIENSKIMSVSPNIYIIFEEEIKSPILQKLKKIAQKIQRFEKLTGQELEKWILEEAGQKNLTLAKSEIGSLILNFGDNLWATNNALELKKLGGSIEANIFNYNPFELADFFARKEGRSAYFTFHKNISNGVLPEEMFWKLWWQIKTLLLVLNYKESGLNNFQIKGSTGLHPYVIQKSISALAKFSRAELEKIWDELFLMWYESRLGVSDLSFRIEQFLLSV